MTSKVKVTIPKPCQENWLEMSPDEKVRFCNLCQKNVFNDSTNENNEIVCLRYNAVLLETKKNKTTVLNKLISKYLIKRK